MYLFFLVDVTSSVLVVLFLCGCKVAGQQLHLSDLPKPRDKRTQAIVRGYLLFINHFARMAGFPLAMNINSC